jgi:hypothetical protein
MAWFDFLNQANPRGRDAGSIARQRLSGRSAIPAAKPTTAKPMLPRGAGLGTSFALGSLLGDYVAAPIAVGIGDYLRSDQGQLFKDRLRQGDIGGAFTAVTGFGRSNAPVLNQYNPPGFIPGSQITSSDILKSATEVARQRPEERIDQRTPFTRPPGTSSFTPLDPYAAQNREYERERARVEAMVKANPDMQKQAIADERAKVRDQGMAIWAQKNPELAAKLQPGAVGYDAVQQALIGKNAGQAARESFGYQTPQQITLTPPPGVNAPQSFPPVESITPTETYGAQGIQTDPEMVKKFQTLLNLTKK